MENKTSQTIDGITIDLNLITRGDYRRLMSGIIQSTGDEATETRLTGELAAKVVTAWPFEQEISQAGYLELGVYDAGRVDDALLTAIAALRKKAPVSGGDGE